MKKVTYILTVLIALFFSQKIEILTQTHPPVYLTLVSHNEDQVQWLNNSYYISKRNILVQIANIVQSKGAVWSHQSDWRFLQAVALYDTGSVLSNTNGKNLIRWMVEDKGVICDPHSHEGSGYNYADVAYLHQQLGITPTKIVGGFLYDTVINGNNWENLQNGIYGRIYTSYFWQPDVLWGGGTPGHQNDPYPLGAWKPQSMANYYYHDTTKHLVLLGHGCDNHIEDTSNITYNTQIIRTIVNDINYGMLPDSGFYPAYSFFNEGDLNQTRVDKISQFIDSIAPMVTQGKVSWKNLTEIYNIWNTTYGKKPYWVMCENIPLAVQQLGSGVPTEFSLKQNYPNPFNPTTKIQFMIPKTSEVKIVIFDIAGREIETLVNEEMSSGTYEADWDGSKYSSGVYFYKLETESFAETRKMVLLK